MSIQHVVRSMTEWLAVANPSDPDNHAAIVAWRDSLLAIAQADKPTVEIRGTHWAQFRSGQWATLVGVAWLKDRPCYQVRFSDGATDSWVIDDPSERYEFRALPLPHREAGMNDRRALMRTPLTHDQLAELREQHRTCPAHSASENERHLSVHQLLATIESLHDEQHAYGLNGHSQCDKCTLADNTDRPKGLGPADTWPKVTPEGEARAERQTITTKSGAVLTESDINNLADKAEEGFDLTEWKDAATDEAEKEWAKPLPKPDWHLDLDR